MNGPLQAITLLGKENAMPANVSNMKEPNNPVAILDKDLMMAGSFKIEHFELCTMCGACFGIGYLGILRRDLRVTEEVEDLPRRLTEILAKDHRQDREHRHIIELDI